mmetsp:Transcript_22437/g.63096  ORF Transcript_22437/g.63096 Transcript_22437/m.63096 type:complete len:279 (-) Transcript_22437:65-901(-)
MSISGAPGGAKSRSCLAFLDMSCSAVRAAPMPTCGVKFIKNMKPKLRPTSCRHWSTFSTNVLNLSPAVVNNTISHGSWFLLQKCRVQPSGQFGSMLWHVKSFHIALQGYAHKSSTNQQMRIKRFNTRSIENSYVGLSAKLLFVVGGAASPSSKISSMCKTMRMAVTPSRCMRSVRIRTQSRGDAPNSYQKSSLTGTVSAELHASKGNCCTEATSAASTPCARACTFSAPANFVASHTHAQAAAWSASSKEDRSSSATGARSNSKSKQEVAVNFGNCQQ